MATKSLCRAVTSSLLQTRSAAQVAVAEAVRDDKNKWLDVKWKDGKTGRFPYVWLRDNCPAPHTYYISPFSKARLVKLYEFPLDIQPKQVSTVEDGVNIEWEGKESSVYSSDWLRQRNLSDTAVTADRNDILLPDKKVWNRKKFTDHMKFHNFEAVLNDDLACHDALTDLIEWGLTFFDNIKPESGEILRLSNHLGFHYKTHYGDTFHVRFKRDPANVGNETNEELDLHTDHAYQEMIPDVQMLHCIENFGFGSGGESVFSDAFNAAEIMSKTRPDLYKLLCEIPFEYIDEGIDFIPFDAVAKYPLFNFNLDGKLSKVVFNNHMRSWFMDVPPEQIQSIYEAIMMFRRTVHDEANSFQIQLQAGQMVAFDNGRVMHGRTGFEVTKETQRHLQGIFFSWDCIKSRVRVLRDRHNIQPNPITI